MQNPFEKRATELLRDDADAFLAIVSPEPVTTFLRKPAKAGQLYDRLVVIRGSPGTGKTTLAQLFEYRSLATLLRNPSAISRKGIVAALSDCNAIGDSRPLIAGCRVPLETDYRDIWEFPYPAELKTGLLTALVQARSVLRWLRGFESSNIRIADVGITSRRDAEAATVAIGGTDAEAVLERARQVESAIYRISASLVAPTVGDIDPVAISAYRPFDVLESFSIPAALDVGPPRLVLKPLVMLDDAHNLHPAQFVALQRWLARRELRVGRWVMTRLDILTPRDVFAADSPGEKEHGELPGLTASRDIIEINLQTGPDGRRGDRRDFRRMARDMANRYLQQIPLFAGRQLQNLGDLLSAQPRTVSSGKLTNLVQMVDREQRKLDIQPARRKIIEESVDSYIISSKRGDVTEDVRFAMIRILLHRYAKRVPQGSLFEASSAPEPSRPITADSTVADGACLHLMHLYDRPYYFGIDALCDASSENVEQFLRLAGVLVDAAATQLVRAKPASLSATLQHRALRERAGKIISGWNFPHCDRIRRLVHRLATRCVERSLEPNAPLGGGANAFGIRQTEFDGVPNRAPDLAQVLKYAIAYNAFNMVPRYSCKNEQWCLLELGGIVLLHYGLTLRRGGFVESSMEELERMVREEPL